ncbi:MAG TPA: hypothetical protein VL460_02250 [Caulobacteraceae bacterium]|jgi:hypothetical protein|nr:hypothetical protein [Caulobacteraceae bacterium]
MRALILAAFVAVAPAAAHAWEVYSYPDDGFAVQLPAVPAVTRGEVRTAAGAAVPAVTYALREADAAYTLVVADFSATAVEKDAAVAEAVKAWSGRGEVKVDVEARIDRQFGRSMSLAGADGSRSLVSIFFVGRKLYQLEAKALPPRPDAGSAKTLQFQQSLEFIGLGAEALRPENRPPGAVARGPGGPGGPGPRRPPPQAFEACVGKAAGEAVQLTTPAGAIVGAACRRTPQGLAAIPDRPLAGGGPPG